MDEISDDPKDEVVDDSRDNEVQADQDEVSLPVAESDDPALTIRGSFTRRATTINSSSFSPIFLGGTFQGKIGMAPFGYLTIERKKGDVIFADQVPLDNIAFLINTLAINIRDAAEKVSKVASGDLVIFWPARKGAIDWLEEARVQLDAAVDTMKNIETVGTMPKRAEKSEQSSD